MRFPISLGVALWACVLGFSQAGNGQEVNPEKRPIMPPVPQAVAPHAINTASDRGSTRADHLFTAADHLAAAGLQEDAKKYRKLGAAERLSLANATDILVRLKMIEVPTAKLKQLGLDAPQTLEPAAVGAPGGEAGLTGTGVGKNVLPPQAASSFRLVDDGSRLFNTLDTLRKEGGVRVLAEPNIVTVSGRPADFHVGGSVPVPPVNPVGATPIEYVEYGTRVQLLPVVLADRRLRLDVRFTVSDLDRDATEKAGGRPAIRSSGMASTMEMKSGQTAVLSGLRQKKTVPPQTGVASESKCADNDPNMRPAAAPREAEDVDALLVFVMAEIVEPPFGGNSPAVSRLPDRQPPRQAAPGGVTR